MRMQLTLQQKSVSYVIDNMDNDLYLDIDDIFDVVRQDYKEGYNAANFYTD